MISFSRLGEHSDKLGTFSIYTFFVTAWLAPGIANLSLLLMLIAMLLSVKNNGINLAKNPVFILVLLWNSYLALRLGISYTESPDQFNDHLSATIDFAKLSLFIVVGWWAYGDEKKLKLLLLLALAGIAMNMLKRIDWEILSREIERDGRFGFGVQIPVSALLCGSALFGLLMMFRQFVGAQFSRTAYIRLTTWFILVLIFTSIVIMTQTRTIWIALSFVTPLCFLILYIACRKNRNSSLAASKNTPLKLSALAASLLFVITIGSQAEAITKRFKSEQQTVEAIFSSDSQTVKGTSLGLRYHANILGGAKFAEHPIIGWGSGYSAAEAIRKDLPRKLYHLHNTYLEILVRLGLAGGLLLMSGLLILQKSLYASYKARKISAELAITLLGLELILGIWCLTDFQLLRGYWQMYWYILGGILFSLTLTSSKPSTENPSSCNAS